MEQNMRLVYCIKRKCKLGVLLSRKKVGGGCCSHEDELKDDTTSSPHLAGLLVLHVQEQVDHTVAIGVLVVVLVLTLVIHVQEEFAHTVAVAVLIVVPGDQLDEVLVQCNASAGIEDGGAGVAVEVCGHNHVLCVSQDSVHGSISCGLDNLLDGVHGGGLLQADCQVNNGDVGGGDTESHTSQLAVELGHNLADSLGGSGRGGDDVLGSATAIPPQLAGGSINSLLGGSHSMDGAHESLNDSEVVVDNLGQRSQAVGGAGSVADNGHGWVELVVVDSHDEHGGIGTGGRDHNLLGTTLEVSGALLDGCEHTSRLNNIVGSSLLPWDVSGVPLVEDLDLHVADAQLAALVPHITVLPHSVGGIILEHVHHVVNINEWVIDGHNVDLATAIEGGAGHQATDASKSVDSDLNHFARIG